MKYKGKIIGLAIMMLTACSSSRITSTWKKAELQPGSYTKIMVIGIIKDSDRLMREKMENHLTGDLRNLGYDAFSALNVYGANGLDKLDTLAAYKKLRDDHVDAVITIVLLDKKREKYLVRRQHDHLFYEPDQNYFLNYYHNMQDRINDKNYFEESTQYFWESKFYDLNRKELLYAVQTQSFDPMSASSLGHEYGQLIVRSMVKNQLLVKQTVPAKSM
jgi:hypothetical protein